MLRERQQASMSRPAEAQATKARKWRRRRTYQGIKRLSEAQVRWLEAYNADRERGQEERLCACRRGRRRRRRGAGRGQGAVGMSREDGVGRRRIGCGTSIADKDSGRACPKWAAVGACRERSAANTSKIAAPSKIEQRRQKNVFWRRWGNNKRPRNEEE